MPRVRTTIGRLLGWTVLAALGLTAYRGASEFWVTLTLLGAIGILIWACLQARYGAVGAGDWWFGFALLGWPHLLASAVTNDGHLPTDLVLGKLLFGSQVSITFWPVFSVEYGPLSIQDHYRFQVGHNMLSLGAGWLGGWGVAWYAARARRRSETIGRPNEG